MKHRRLTDRTVDEIGPPTVDNAGRHDVGLDRERRFTGEHRFVVGAQDRLASNRYHVVGLDDGASSADRVLS